MSTVKTKTWKGNLSHLMANTQVRLLINSARKTAREDGYDQIIYQDEPGSFAYVRSCLYGTWDYQTEDKIIAKIIVEYE